MADFACLLNVTEFDRVDGGTQRTIRSREQHRRIEMDATPTEADLIDLEDDDTASVVERPPSQSEGFAAAAEGAVSAMSMATLKASMMDQIVRFDESVCIIEDRGQPV